MIDDFFQKKPLPVSRVAPPVPPLGGLSAPGSGEERMYLSVDALRLPSGLPPEAYARIQLEQQSARREFNGESGQVLSSKPGGVAAVRYIAHVLGAFSLEAYEMGRLKLWTFQQVQDETWAMAQELTRSVSRRNSWESKSKIDGNLLRKVEATEEWVQHEKRLQSLGAIGTTEAHPGKSSNADHENLDKAEPDYPQQQFSLADRTLAIAKNPCEELNGIFDRAIKSFSLFPGQSAQRSAPQANHDAVHPDTGTAPTALDSLKTMESDAEDDPAQYGRWGGLGWQVYPELGLRNHALIGEYFPRLSAATPVERCKLYAELAVKMYKSHADMRLELVRPGKMQDVSAFDDEHPLRCSLGVWDLLGRAELDEAEINAINFALVGCRSTAIAAALKRVNSINNDETLQTRPPNSGDCLPFGKTAEPEPSSVVELKTKCELPDPASDNSVQSDPTTWPASVRYLETIAAVKQMHQCPKKLIPERVARQYLAQTHRISPDEVTQRQLRELMGEYASHYGAVELVEREQLNEDDGHRMVPAEPREQPQIFSIGKWDDLQIVFLSDQRLQMHALGATAIFNYEEIGFADRRNRKPNRAWEILRQFAEQGGTIKHPRKGKWESVEKSVQNVRKSLRVRFGLTDDPLPFQRRTGYCACFQISCSPSYDH